MLLLFTDASRTRLQVLKNIRNLPVRLLSTGMLLSIILGALLAILIFPKLSIWEAGILAAILRRPMQGWDKSSSTVHGYR